MAYGEEQSILILPSQSTVMKRKVASTTSLTTVSGIRYRSAIIGQSLGFAKVVTENRVRDYGRRRVALTIVDHHLNVVARQNLQRGGERRFRKGMGVNAEKEWTVDAVLQAVEADRLRDGEYVLL